MKDRFSTKSESMKSSSVFLNLKKILGYARLSSNTGRHKVQFIVFDTRTDRVGLPEIVDSARFTPCLLTGGKPRNYHEIVLTSHAVVVSRPKIG